LPQALQVKASSLAGGPGFGFAPLPGTASTPLPLLNITGPTSNDAVTGTYSKTLTITLSTTQP
jgi:hypothetical protein